MSDSARTLGELLFDSCQRWPDRTAVMVHDKSGWKNTTYKEHLANVERYASALQGLGLKRGDRLVLLGENSYEWALADWAALSASRSSSRKK